MKILDFDNNQVIWTFALLTKSGPFYLPDAVDRLVKRYRFADYPKSIKEMKTEFGSVRFSHGEYNNSVVDSFQIFQGGLVAEGKISTKILDEFLEDFVGFAKQEYDLEITDLVESRKFYESRIVCQLNFDIEDRFNFFSEMMTSITDSLMSYGVKTSKYQPIGLSFHADPSKVEDIYKPRVFSIEKRIGLPYDKNIYYSSAPLKTDDHIALLTKFLEGN